MIVSSIIWSKARTYKRSYMVGNWISAVPVARIMFFLRAGFRSKVIMTFSSWYEFIWGVANLIFNIIFITWNQDFSQISDNVVWLAFGFSVSICFIKLAGVAKQRYRTNDYDKNEERFSIMKVELSLELHNINADTLMPISTFLGPDQDHGTIYCGPPEMPRLSVVVDYFRRQLSLNREITFLLEHKLDEKTMLLNNQDLALQADDYLRIDRRQREILLTLKNISEAEAKQRYPDLMEEFKANVEKQGTLVQQEELRKAIGAKYIGVIQQRWSDLREVFFKERSGDLLSVIQDVRQAEEEQERLRHQLIPDIQLRR